MGKVGIWVKKNRKHPINRVGIGFFRKISSDPNIQKLGI